MNTVTLNRKRTLVGMFSMAALALGAHNASAAQQCYEFNNLPVNVNYGIGSSFTAPHAVIQVKEFHVTTGVPSNAGIQFAEVSAGNIALGAAPPEIHTYLANLFVTPDAPVKRVTLNFGEATSVNLPIANLEVNGDRRVYNGLPQALPQANLDRIGSNGNYADVAVNWVPPSGGSNFNRGTLELIALPGQYIHTFAIGGDQHFFDALCLSN